MDKYLNVVCFGSKVFNFLVYILDIGEELKVEILCGKVISDKGIELN